MRLPHARLGTGARALAPKVRRSVAIIGTRGYPSYYGGFETAVRHLAPYLADAGWDVTVYGRAGTTDHSGPRDRRIRSVITIGLQRRSLSTLSYGLTAVLHAAAKRPDAALVMNVANGYWLPMLRLLGIRTVVNVDGLEWQRAKWGRVARAVFRLGARLTARWADDLVVDARAVGTEWQRLYHRRGTFIPYGGTPACPGKTVPFPPGNYVLFVARLVPENTVQEFFDAVPALARDRHVVIVGSSGYGGELDDRARDLDAELERVHWLGHVSDDNYLFALWQNAGVYFHGHSVGGTNPALVQAMTCGAPIVARDTVYNREVLGTSGEFCSPARDSILESMAGILRDPARRTFLGEAAKKRAAEHYSWTAVCAAYEKLLSGHEVK
jgi:glycosyltransferase involved in cell wall biosynthesis